MADEPVTLEQVKQHLKLDVTDTGQDGYLKLMIAAARREIEHFTGKQIYATWPTLADADRVLVAQASLLTISHWFVNREGGEEVPAAARALVRPLKRHRV